MPTLVEPESVLPAKQKLRPSQLIMFLLYPVIFAVGLTVGVIIGIRQGQQTTTNQFLANQARVNSTVIPNANTRVQTNTAITNGNTNTVLNSNSALSGGDYLKLDGATQADLTRRQQHDEDTLVDQTASLDDIVRQQDIISVKYRLEAYLAVEGNYPTTAQVQIHLDRSSTDRLYQALKAFYGGSYNEPIDPQSPDYYYGYASDGSSFELTAYLVSKKKVFKVTNS